MKESEEYNLIKERLIDELKNSLIELKPFESKLQPRDIKLLDTLGLTLKDKTSLKEKINVYDRIGDDKISKISMIIFNLRCEFLDN